jgi:uncharacterized protein YjaG (DUF416 family)
MISNQQVLEVRLEKLSKTLVSVFCLLGAERLFGIYKAFANKFSVSHTTYLGIIENAYELIFKPDEKQLKALREKLEKFIPDSEEYVDVLADQAQCSGLCLMYALAYLESGDVSMALYSVQKISEAIDIYGYERGGKLELLKKEADCQIETITFLEDHNQNLEKGLKKYRNINTKSIIPEVS